jgi:hypothetical protein
MRGTQHEKRVARYTRGTKTHTRTRTYIYVCCVCVVCLERIMNDVKERRGTVNFKECVQNHHIAWIQILLIEIVHFIRLIINKETPHIYNSEKVKLREREWVSEWVCVSVWVCVCMCVYVCMMREKIRRRRRWRVLLLYNGIVWVWFYFPRIFLNTVRLRNLFSRPKSPKNRRVLHLPCTSLSISLSVSSNETIQSNQSYKSVFSVCVYLMCCKKFRRETYDSFAFFPITKCIGQLISLRHFLYIGRTSSIPHVCDLCIWVSNNKTVATVESTRWLNTITVRMRIRVWEWVRESERECVCLCTGELHWMAWSGR